jgi:hypothetical protein
MTTQPAHHSATGNVMTNVQLDEPRTAHGVLSLRFDVATMDWRVIDFFCPIRSRRA